MKNFYRPLVLSALMLLVFSGLKAQDPRFSQYNASPLTLNPAMTGVFNGNYRISAIYRSQWHSILKADDPQGTPLFRTFSGAFDMRFNVNKTDGIGVGLVFLTDKAGAADYGTNQLNLNFSYSKGLGQQGAHNIALGISAGGAIRGINYNALRFGNQFDGTGFDPTHNSGETNISDNLKFFDISAGLFYYFVNKNSSNKGRSNAYGGFAVSHLNRPNQSFYSGQSADLYMKYTVSGGGGFPIATQVDLQPSFMFMKQGPALETDLGTYVKIFFTPNDPNGNAFYIGPWYRIVTRDNVTAKGGIASEALILMTKLDYSSFTLGFSFDLNLSELTNATNTNGAFEISLAHAGSFAKHNKVYICPRF